MMPAKKRPPKKFKTLSISEGVNGWESEGQVVYDKYTHTYYYKEGGAWKAVSEEYAKAKRMVDNFTAKIEAFGQNGTSCVSSAKILYEQQCEKECREEEECECSVAVGDEESTEIYQKPKPLTAKELERLAVLKDFLAWIADNPEVQYRLNLITFRYPWDK